MGVVTATAPDLIVGLVALFLMAVPVSEMTRIAAVPAPYAPVRLAILASAM